MNDERVDADHGGNYIQSVGRALSVLELFTDKQPSLTVSEIAALTGLNRATSYRFTQTLRSLGYLDEVDRNRYRPGLKAIALAQSALSSLELPELAGPVLARLRDSTRETVNLSMRDGGETVLISRLLGEGLINFRFYVGTRLPIHASSMGRAMLAQLDDLDARAVLESARRERLTDRTLVDVDEIMNAIRNVRTKGYALVDEEMAAGLRGVAAVVIDDTGQPVAGINVSVSRPFIGDEAHTFFAPAVVSAAKELSDLVSAVRPSR